MVQGKDKQEGRRRKEREKSLKEVGGREIGRGNKRRKRRRRKGTWTKEDG